MKKTIEQQLLQVTRDIKKLVSLRDTGIQCQSNLDQKYWKRDELVRKQKEKKE